MTLMEKLFEKHMLINKIKELQTENAVLRECLSESVDYICAGCPRNPCEGSCVILEKCRNALANASGEEVKR